MLHRLCMVAIALSVGTPLASWGQADTAALFRPLLRRLWQQRFYNALSTPPAFSLPVVYRDSTRGSYKHRQLNFELRLADQPLALQRRIIKLAVHGYPVCYSVVFENSVVALFKNGKFGCYRLPDLVPDERLEWKLNVGGWERCWLIDGQLIAQNISGYYAYDATTQTWQTYEQPMPLGKRPKLYEDARYLAYADCNGEFGGTVYFYNKHTQQTHWANATCANSVWQENDQYYLLVSLGHMVGSAACATIANPEVLPLVKTAKSSRRIVPAGPPQGNGKVDWQYDFTQRERGVVRLFDYSGLQLFSEFRWQGQMLYLMHWRNTTFLATIAGQRITIVDPLFADGLYTFNPVTTTYGAELALTNLNNNDLPETSELAALLWQGQQVIKIEWGKQPAEMK